MFKVSNSGWSEGNIKVIKGLFFDLDGTLVDTYQADFLAYHDAVQEIVGLELAQDQYASLYGMEIGAKLAVLAPQLTAGQVTAIRESKKRHYPTYVHLTIPNKALIAFLAQFANHQHCALVTTAKSANVASILEWHGLGDFFSTVVCGDDVQHAKPHPEPYLQALQKANLRPEEVLAFEDSDSGTKSAEAAGIAVIRVQEFATS